jgi:lipopolysaccharide biosynthesis glycosyltransferase
MSNNKITIVSSADHNYFNMLNELIDSILRFEQSSEIKICIVDGGLHKNQLEILKSKVFKIRTLNHDLKNIEKFKKNPYFTGLVSRLFLRETFPEFEKFIWIDSDAWLNSWDTIEYLINASTNGKLAAAATADRHNEKLLNFKWLCGPFGLMKSQNFKHARNSGYGSNVCKKIALKPHINCGVFCLDYNSSFWDLWKKHYIFSIKKGSFFAKEQLAMNICIYHENLPCELLPHFCNWIPTADTILWDENRKIFVEKYFPHNPIGIMHLAGGYKVDGVDMRQDKSKKISIKTTEGHTILRSLRYHFD